MTRDEAVARARALFLDDANVYGCAETTLIVLKEAFGLPEPEDSSAALALNGGVAYSGGICGAISGAAIAVGILAAQRIPSHAAAKRAARRIVARQMEEFRAEYGAVDCRTLLGREIRTPAQHRAFIADGAWRRTCMAQIEFVVARLATLPTDPPSDQATGRAPRGIGAAGRGAARTPRSPAGDPQAGATKAARSRACPTAPIPRPAAK